MLAAAGRTVESLPPDMQMAYNTGQLSKSAVQRFLSLESNWFTKIFMPLQGARGVLYCCVAWHSASE